jgi:ABC-type polysaccharide/polyol phosphate export permease
MTRYVRFAQGVVWRDIQLAFTSRVPFLFDVLGVLGSLGLYYFIGRFVRPHYREGALGFAAFATTGIAVLRFQASVMAAINKLEQDQVTGRLELLLLSPVPAVVTGPVLAIYDMARGLVFAIIALVLGRFVFGIGFTLGPRAWAGLACGLLGAIVFFTLLTVLVASFAIAVRQGAALGGLFSFALPVLSGAFFPVRLLPRPIDSIAEALPLSKAIVLVRDGVDSATFSPGRAAVMFATLALATPLVLLLFRASVDYARRRGSLSHH